MKLWTHINSINNLPIYKLSCNLYFKEGRKKRKQRGKERRTEDWKREREGERRKEEERKKTNGKWF